MACSMRSLMEESFQRKYPITPYQVANNLQRKPSKNSCSDLPLTRKIDIAKHMRKGRQEDSHEFLRYAIDALQKSCLFAFPPYVPFGCPPSIFAIYRFHCSKIDHKLAETTWVHKLFGGRLRSRVHCLSCGYNSDTFDSILDLSVDIYGVSSLADALRKFVAVDHLKGADKYKCDKFVAPFHGSTIADLSIFIFHRCKKHVSADKQFTVHEAPTVLSIHLKRFSPMGRKIGHQVNYGERICLQPIMSEGQHGPVYNLYGVISHAGGGPNSGHYYAHVRAANGQWYEMNDDAVERRNGALNMKNRKRVKDFLDASLELELDR